MTTLTQLEFVGDDFMRAQKIAHKLGYTETAYASSSALVGLFCLRGCIIKTVEMGFLFVQDEEDLLR